MIPECRHSAHTPRVNCGCAECSQALTATGMPPEALRDLRTRLDENARRHAAEGLRARQNARQAAPRPESRSSIDYQRRPVEGPDR